MSLGMAISPGSLQEITAFSCPLFPIFFAFLHTSAWMFLSLVYHTEKQSASLCVHCNIPPAMLGLAVSRHNSESNKEKIFWFFLIGIVQTCIWLVKRSTGPYAVNERAFKRVGKVTRQSKEDLEAFSWSPSNHFLPLSSLLKVVIGGINVDFIAKARNPEILVLYL